ncbi:hypothetical protein [Sphingomonas immobilis]|uniref:Uncharacterized protein n=1 Tax=Sphingomonas immobilis TaxID=3063997 RepID=A0ABT9A4Z8_9SPHN|nr:hypothetical protein [Sphingomonas sp. CA1-15]MDO7844608.1 hypothetical protein [Sphingomonas sp. CA1-15]
MTIAIPAGATASSQLLKPWRDYKVDEVKAAILNANERVIVGAAAIALGLLIFTEKLALQPANIEYGFFAVAALCVFLVLRGSAYFLPVRTLAYCGVAALMIVITFASPIHAAFSIPSLLFMIILHIPFCMRVDLSRLAYLRILLWFEIFALVIASFVYFQWLQQAAGMRMLNMEDYLPQSMMFDNYNYVQKINYFSHWYKPNGFFMLETSYASQVLALAGLIELALFRRPVRLAYIVLAQLSTYGGTGMIVLGCGMLVAVFYLRFKEVVALAVAVPLLFGLAMTTGIAENAMGRTMEFSHSGTSGNGRFVAPFEIARDTVLSSKTFALTGVGPGVVSPYHRLIQDTLNPLTKLVVEYGIPVAVLWMLWYHACMIMARVPFIAFWAFFIQYDALGGAAMVPLVTYYCLLISCLFVPTRYIAPAMRRPTIPNRLRPSPLRRLGPASATAATQHATV